MFSTSTDKVSTKEPTSGKAKEASNRSPVFASWMTLRGPSATSAAFASRNRRQRERTPRER